MTKILFIGPVAQTGGPAIKNRILLEHLQQTHNVNVCNTYDQSLKARMGAVLAILFAKKCQIIVSVSRKGRNLLYPFLLLKKKMSHLSYACIVIGGNVIGSFKTPGSVKALRNADVVTIETEGLYHQMSTHYQLNNLYWMPNYKEDLQDAVMSLPEHDFDEEVLRFLFLSSMRNVKGVKTLFDAFSRVLALGYPATLDYYGPIKKDMDPAVLQCIEDSDAIHYRGMVSNQEVLQTMSRYHVFVFPTEYTGEGFPAVLVEAQAAGLPIISSDMNDNAEIVNEGENGWIFHYGHVDELVEKIIHCFDHREALKAMSVRNQKVALRYDAKCVLDDFEDELRKHGWEI